MVITFETAKIAKEKEIQLKTTIAYDLEGNLGNYYDIVNEPPFNWNETQIDYDALRYPAPTQEQLQKHIREKHGMHLVIIPTETANWTYKVITVLSERNYDFIRGIKSVSDLPPYKEVCGEDFSTYEDAFEAGLKEELKQINL